LKWKYPDFSSGIATKSRAAIGNEKLNAHFQKKPFLRRVIWIIIVISILEYTKKMSCTFYQIKKKASLKESKLA